MNESAYFVVLSLIFSVPYITMILACILLYYSLLKHRAGDILNACLQQTYTALGYLFVISERVLPIPFLAALFQLFACRVGKENFSEEPVTIPLSASDCWSGPHIAVLVVGICAAILYVLLIIATFLLYSSQCYVSPLLWADQHTNLNLAVLGQKIVVACFLVFDANVLSLISITYRPPTHQ